MVVEKRINEIVNRLNKTKEERFPDLRMEREERDREEREDKRKELQAKVMVKCIQLSVYRRSIDQTSTKL